MGLLSGLLLGLVGCHDTTVQRIDERCFEEGRCACRNNADCGGGATCVDGECRALSDVVFDTSSDASDTAQDAPEGDVVIEPGAFQWPCTADTECNSQKCLAISASDKVCTRVCIESCPAGWNCRGLQSGATVDFFCVPERERLCEPCLLDEACPGEGSACVQLADEAACGRACAGATDCPEGYACGDATSVGGAAVRQCLPESGVCQCRPGSAGLEVPCSVEGELGICFGTQVCQIDGSLGACSARTPATETCNGQDDDCNGFTDDRIAIVECFVENAAGRCEGERVCLPGAGEVCTAATPRLETCDNLDDDCDDATDEDFRVAGGRIATLEHCGACGESCLGRFPHAAELRCEVPTAQDASPRCVVAACESGFVRASETECVRPPDLLCAPCTSDAVCGGPDNRCLALDGDERRFCGRDCGPDSLYGECPEGYVCEDSAGSAQCVPAQGACDCSAQNDGQTRPCSIQNEAGACFGVARCDDATGWSGCTARTPSVEVCNGLDDDCDGIGDDGLGGAPCLRDNLFGKCPGRQTCDGASGALVCVGPDARAESCNGVDDDCDGETDEDFAFNIRDDSGAIVALKYARTNAHCGGCNLGCDAVAPVTAVTCDGSGLQPFCAVQACAPGFWVAERRVCLPIPSGNLCLPCESDAECQGPDDRCLLDSNGGADGGRCGRDCGLGSIYTSTSGPGAFCDGLAGERGCCPTGYLCDGEQCRPESGDCTCDVDGELRTCARENAAGRCLGIETCVARGVGGGWGGCTARTPAPEVCNGVDDDCDGLVDSDDAGVDVSGLAGYPDCERVSEACSGRWVCGGDAGWSCTAREPEPELCNGRDDDCDGVVDDGFVDAGGLFTRVDNCGQCGLDCRQAIANLAPGESAACQLQGGGAPTCVPLRCKPGFVPFPSGAPRVCLPLAAASCRPCTADAECGPGGDACLAVGAGEGTFCAQPCGLGSAYAGCTGALGEQGCCASGYTCEAVDGGSWCLPVSGSCLCSAERLGAVRGCEALGNAGATTCFGVETCTFGGGGFAWGSCDLSANVEVCDALDNDCDGLTDEGFTTGGAYVSNEHCGACGRNCAQAYVGEGLHATGVCAAAAPGGPRCEVGACRASTGPAGLECREDADCVGGRCDVLRHTCETACTTSAECGFGRVCEAGLCATSCTSSLQCEPFGPQASCVAGRCLATFDWVDLDGADGNGCECAAARGRGVDRPDLLGRAATPGAAYLDTDCDGLDGDLATAIFVRAGELAGEGSLEAPFGSIAEAFDALDVSSPAATSATPILVSGGRYEEALVLPRGVVLHGGYSPDFSHRDVVLHPTLVVARRDELAPGALGTVTAQAIDAPTELVGFTIVGWDAALAGEATYGLYVRDATHALVVANCVIIGGRGAPGAAGDHGAPGGGGGDGVAGRDSRECADNDCGDGTETQAGGASGTNPACAAAVGCVGMEADSDENPQVKDAAASGCSYTRGGDQGSYGGGPAELCKYDFSPGGNQVGGDGTDGFDGADGLGGAGCGDADGALVDGRWVGGAGQIGVSGFTGLGGNGGAAGGWANNAKDATCSVPGVGLNRGDLGGSGGGGGAGGCGGGSGLGGGAGGASFAAFVAPRGTSHPRLEHNTIIRGPGGAGGVGGNGGTGGRGGTGGAGGLARWPAWGAGIGGTGGRGGDGGDAGGGGGGCGGPSFGIAGPGLAATTYATLNGFALTDGIATGGPGGAGGLSAGSGAGSAGTRGESRNVKVF